MANVRNYEEYRAEVLERLGDDYTVEDLRNTERWRLRVLDMLSGGGGGESDFSTANVTLTIGAIISQLGIQGACILEDDGVDYLDTSFPIAKNTTSVIPAVLYKGEGTVMIDTSNTVTLGGNIHQVAPNAYSITGDCTITIS